MANSRANRLYAPEFRRQIVEPVRSGRNPQELAREFEPSAQAIRNWVAQVDRDEGRTDGLTTAERDELSRLRRENRQLKLEREILSKAAAQVSPGRPARSHPGVRVRGCASGRVPGGYAMPRTGGSPTVAIYAWLKRPLSVHAQCDAVLIERIRGSAYPIARDVWHAAHPR